MKILRIVAVIVLLAGACLSGRALYLDAKAELAGILIRRAWEQSIGSGKPHAPWPWSDTHPVARLRIPRLVYDEIVLDSATPGTLAFGPARLMSGASMGEAGNVVLAGHRTSWFRSLEGVKQGDTIEVEWFDTRGKLHERTYTVRLIRVTNPRDVELLAPTFEDSLTLVTCYPFGRSPSSPQRFIVRASPVDPGRIASRAADGTLGRVSYAGFDLGRAIWMSFGSTSANSAEAAGLPNEK